VDLLLLPFPQLSYSMNVSPGPRGACAAQPVVVAATGEAEALGPSTAALARTSYADTIRAENEAFRLAAERATSVPANRSPAVHPTHGPLGSRLNVVA
jgi:hypothetical protein